MITTCIRLGRPIAWVPIRTIYGAPSHIRPLDHLRQFIRIVRKARRDVRTPLGLTGAADPSVGSASISKPSRSAIATAAPRPPTPSFPRMFETWTEAVLSLMNRASPISRLVRPPVSSPRHLLLAGRQTHAEIVPATGLGAEVDARPAREAGDGRKQRFRAESRRGVGRRAQRLRRPPRARHPRPGSFRPGGDGSLPPRSCSPGRRRPRSPPSMPECRTVRRAEGDPRRHGGHRPEASAANARRLSQGPRRPRPGSERDGGRAPVRSPRHPRPVVASRDRPRRLPRPARRTAATRAGHRGPYPPRCSALRRWRSGPDRCCPRRDRGRWRRASPRRGRSRRPRARRPRTRLPRSSAASSTSPRMARISASDSRYQGAGRPPSASASSVSHSATASSQRPRSM